MKPWPGIVALACGYALMGGGLCLPIASTRTARRGCSRAGTLATCALTGTWKPRTIPMETENHPQIHRVDGGAYVEVWAFVPDSAVPICAKEEA